MTAVSNANPGVATLEASHGVALNDIIEVTSGWPRLNGRIVKAGTVNVNDVPLVGINTSEHVRLPGWQRHGHDPRGPDLAAPAVDVQPTDAGR
jgi:hypothetical protein